MLILSSVSKVLPKRFNVFGNSLIILGDMINLCLSSSIFGLSGHSWILITTFRCFTSYDPIAWRRNPSLEQNGRGESLHCINSSDLSSFMLWDSFIPVKASIIEGQIHPLLYKTAMLQWPQLPNGFEPEWEPFRQRHHTAAGSKKLIKSLKIEIPSFFMSPNNQRHAIRHRTQAQCASLCPTVSILSSADSSEVCWRDYGFIPCILLHDFFFIVF